MMYVLVGIVYFIVIMMMFAYIDNVYYNKIDINKQRTIYWNRVIVSSVVVFSISLLLAGIIYNMRENRSVIVPEQVIYYNENKPFNNIINRLTEEERVNNNTREIKTGKPKRKRLTEAERLNIYTREIYPDY